MSPPPLRTGALIAAPVLRPGDTLCQSRFVVQRRLGVGGSGTAYEVVDREQDQNLALKLLHRADGTGIEMLKREFRAAVGLIHPNLVSLYELHAEHDLWFISMELVEGLGFMEYARGANRRLSGGGAMDIAADATLRQTPDPAQAPVAYDEGRLRRCLGQIALGVQAIHDGGQVHRDLKPSNVMVDSQGRVVIMDFGLSLPLQRRGRGLPGNPVYGAPEQTREGRALPASDWYAFGVMLYEALTGHVPFAGAAADVMAAKATLRARAPAAMVAAVPSDLDQLVVELLNPSPAVRPGGEEILRRLGRSSAAQRSVLRPDASAAAPFIGRARELSALYDAFQRTDDGAPVFVQLEGEDGIGKSTLAEHFAMQLRRRGDTVVLSGRCYERESVPYKGFDELVEGLATYLLSLDDLKRARLVPRHAHALTRMFPVLERVELMTASPEPVTLPPDLREARRRAHVALKDMLAAIAQGSRLALFVDDLQWADADGQELLAELFASPDPPALLLVGVRRDESPPSSTRNLRPAPERLPLGPLGQADVRRLCQSLHPAAAADPPAALECEGNPYLITQLLGMVRESAESAESSAAGSSQMSLDQALRRKLSSLSPHERQLLDVIAVAGRPVPAPVACAAADVPALTTPLAIKASRLVRGAPMGPTETLELCHSRVRRFLLAEMAEEDERLHHLQLAVSLERHPESDRELLAEHYFRSGELGRASHHAATAARSAFSALAFERAARLFGRALEYGVRDEHSKDELRLGRARSLANAGHSAAAARVYLEASRLGPTEQSDRCRRLAAEHLLLSGRLDEGVEAIAPALAQLGLALADSDEEATSQARRLQQRLARRGLHFEPAQGGGPDARSQERIDALWAMALGMTTVDELGRHKPFVVRHLLEALDAGAVQSIVRGICLFVMVLELDPSMGTGAGPMLEQAQRLSAESPDPHSQAWLGLTGGWWEMCLLHPRNALSRLLACEATLLDRCKGATREVGMARAMIGACLGLLTDVQASERYLEPWVREARAREDVYLEAFARSCRWLPLLAQDQPQAALHQLDEAQNRWGRDRVDAVVISSSMARVLVEAYRGGPRASELMASYGPRFEASRYARLPYFRAWFLMARTAAQFAVHGASVLSPQLCQLIESDAKALCELSQSWGEPQGRMLLASLANRRGAREEALDLLAQALEAFDAPEGDQVRAACALRRRGELLGGAEGRRLQADADARMRAHGIVAPDRWASLMAPGF